MVEAKPSSFLEQTKRKSKRSLPTIWVAPSWRRKEGEDDSSKVVVVAASREEHERSCVIEKIEVRVFKACLQRPKSVIFEGLVRWFGYGVSEEEEEKVERTWRSQRVREREWEFEKWSEGVCLCMLATAYMGGFGRDFFYELSTTLVPEVVCVRHFGPWHLEINSLVPEVAFRRSR